MQVLLLALLAAVAAAPEVDVSMLDGSTVRGKLLSLDATAATLEGQSGKQQLAAADLLEIRFPQTKPPGDAAAKLSALQLVDGSVLQCSKITVKGQDGIALETPALGSLSTHLASLANIRFGDIEPKLVQAWTELKGRESKRDQLAIRKDDLLDHLDGVVGNIDPEIVRFVSEGEEISVKRAKVFGVVYAKRSPQAARPQCEAALADGSTVRARKVSFDGTKFTVELLDGATTTPASEKIRSLDFSLGKVRYLSQLEPREVKYTPFFDHTWEYERDRNKEGGQLRLGEKTYSRGLWIHSKTFLKYRIGAEYRRFQAVVGIDYLVARNGRGDVHVVISGDGRPLWESDVRGTDPPKPVDLDVSSVRDLEILVDFGGDLDISDHLDLADARVIK